MWIAEKILFQFVRLLYRTEIAHSSEMKNALQDLDAYDHYRAREIGRVVDAVERYRIPLVGQTIVDFGCNDGAISKEYLQRGAARVIGVDIDQDAILRAKEKYPDERLTFVRSSVNSIPIEDQSVDTVISHGVFEHVSQPEMIFKELHRILVPGGKALIGTWSWWHPFAPHLWSVMPVPWAHVFFSEETMLRVCRRVYHSSWYIPNMHDYDREGKRLPDKYTNHAISTDYLNKYLIRDFERGLILADFVSETYPVPFGSRYARWTRFLLSVPWLREFVAGYVWFVLNKPESQATST